MAGREGALKGLDVKNSRSLWRLCLLALVIELAAIPAASAHQQMIFVVVGGGLRKPGLHDVSEHEDVLAQHLNRAQGIRVTQKEYDNYHQGRAIADVKIIYQAPKEPGRELEVREFKLDPKSDALWTFAPQRFSTINVARKTAFEADDDCYLLLGPLDRHLGKPADSFAKPMLNGTSPNGLMGVYVGSKDGAPPKWQEMDRDDVKSDFILEDGVTANYLVFLKTGQVVMGLDSTHFGTGSRYNHVRAGFSWSPDSRWLLEEHHWKWQTGVCVVHRFDDKGRPVSKFDLTPLAERIVTGQLRQMEPQTTDEEVDRYAVTCETNGINNDGSVVMQISAQIPKNEESTWVHVKAEIAIKTDRYEDLSVEVKSIEKVE